MDLAVVIATAVKDAITIVVFAIAATFATAELRGERFSCNLCVSPSYATKP